MRYTSANKTAARKGFVLVAVLVVVVLMTLAAYEFSELVLRKYGASVSYGRYVQARALADSGIQFAAATLGNYEYVLNTLGNNPYDNPAVFQDVIVAPNDVPFLQGRFSLIALPDPDLASSGFPAGYTFGVNDEAAKININTIMQLDSSGQTLSNMLLLLPNMTQNIANAIVDWVDPDESPLPSGAESDYYSALSPGYSSKDGPLDSIEELLFVEGVTPQLLLGNDRNRNGQLDPGEDDGTGTLSPGWAAYLTVYSRELNLDSAGNQRVYINDGNLPTLFQNLQQAVGNDMAVYIMAYRLFGGNPVTGTGNSAPASTSGFASSALGNLNAPANSPTSISSIYQLINTTVTVQGSGGSSGSTVLGCPLNNLATMQELLPQLLDTCTTNQNMVLPGRININTASQTVLSCLPNLSATDVQNIMQSRPAQAELGEAGMLYQTTAWLLTQSVLTATQLQALDPYITGRARVFRVQSNGYFDSGGPTARVEAVIDTNGLRPRIVYWRDLTELGKAFILPASGGTSNGAGSNAAGH